MGRVVEAKADYMSYLCSILMGNLAAIYHTMPMGEEGIIFKDFKAAVLKVSNWELTTLESVLSRKFYQRSGKYRFVEIISL